MRTGLSASIIGHVAILGFGLVAFPSAQQFTAEKLDALPVELVDIGDVTDLAKGSKTSQVKPEDTPQPKAVAKAETPDPAPVETPADKPVEAVQPPPAPPPPPPEPTPEPPAPEPPAPEPPAPPPAPPPPEPPEPQAEIPAPEPVEQLPRPVEARTPKQRPRPPAAVEATVAPPKKVVEVKPAKPKAEEKDELARLAKAEPKQDSFNTDTITALLNKQQPSGGGDPDPAAEPQTVGSVDGQDNAKMTQSEIAALQARLYQCWNPPIAVREAAGLTVSVRIDLAQDGSLAAAPQLLSVGSVSDPRAQVAADSALRAVNQCAPFGDILRPETYAEWRQIDFVFDPSKMLGG